MLEHLAVVAVMAAVLSTGCTNAVDEPQFKITTKRDNDKIEGKAEREKTIFLVHSPIGISEAVIERSSNKWPDTVMLRLHLKGLENFKVTTGKVVLEAAVSSHDSKQPVRQWKDNNESEPLHIKSRYWMDIHLVGDDEKAATTIPMTDGYFEIQLPKALFEDNPKSITVNWIDFYR